jgi:hypothetical protein
MDIVVKPTKIDEWLGFFKWEGCYHYLSSYITRTGNRYTGLSDVDRVRLERELGYAPGTLEPKSSFWDTYSIKIGNDGIAFSINGPLDELKYHFLVNHKNVAKDTGHVTKAHDFVIIDQSIEAAEENKKSELQRECYKYFEKMSSKDRTDFLNIAGISTSTMPASVVEMHINRIIKSTPHDFKTKWIDNNFREINAIIAIAVSENIIRLKGERYMLGTETIGVGLKETIDYLMHKDNKMLFESIKNDIASKEAQRIANIA